MEVGAATCGATAQFAGQLTLQPALEPGHLLQPVEKIEEGEDPLKRSFYDTFYTATSSG